MNIQKKAPVNRTFTGALFNLEKGFVSSLFYRLSYLLALVYTKYDRLVVHDK